jgi:hypothetical protein
MRSSETAHDRCASGSRQHLRTKRGRGTGRAPSASARSRKEHTQGKYSRGRSALRACVCAFVCICWYRVHYCWAWPPPAALAQPKRRSCMRPCDVTLRRGACGGWHVNILQGSSHGRTFSHKPTRTLSTVATCRNVQIASYLAASGACSQVRPTRSSNNMQGLHKFQIARHSLPPVSYAAASTT